MANSDLGHKLTDKELAKLERRIAKLYREAGEELQATIDAYFEQFAKRDEEMKALIGTVQNGKEWTEADYKQWRLNQIGRGERYQAMRDKVAHRVTDANAVAVSYTNDATPGIYSLNRNFTAYTIEQVAGNVGFDLWDEQTVKRLMVAERLRGIDERDDFVLGVIANAGTVENWQNIIEFIDNNPNEADYETVLAYSVLIDDMTEHTHEH